MKNTCYFLLFFAFAIMTSCQNEFGCPDIQDNEILTKNQPQSDTYQHELARLIHEDTREVDYYFTKREEGYLVVNVYGWGYCGELHLLISEEDDLSKKLQNEKGYSGAKLKGLEVSYANKRLTYQGMGSIID